MIEVARSIRTYRERKGLEPALRGPRPALAPGLNAAHRLVLAPPLPEPSQILALRPDTPDRGLTTAWPPGAADAATP